MNDAWLKSALEELLEDLRKNLSALRFEHVLSTTETAISLGRTHQANEIILQVSGYLHDFAREMPVKKQEEILKSEGLEDPIALENPVLHHAKVAAILGKQRYGFPDKWVEPAKWHTTGRAKMTLEDVILYVSDQIEPKRAWSTERLLDEAHTNLSLSFKNCLLQKLEFTLKRGKMVHPDSIQCWNWLCLGNSWAD